MPFLYSLILVLTLIPNAMAKDATSLSELNREYVKERAETARDYRMEYYQAVQEARENKMDYARKAALPQMEAEARKDYFDKDDDIRHDLRKEYEEYLRDVEHLKQEYQAQSTAIRHR